MKDKKIKAHFCPRCKSFEVGYVFNLSSWLGLSPRMKCRKCKFEMPNFPILKTTKKKLEKNLKQKRPNER